MHLPRSALWAWAVALLHVAARPEDSQSPFEEPSDRHASDIRIGKEWQVIGPLESGTREHPFLSSPIHSLFRDPAYKSPDHELAFGSAFEEGARWPSAICVDGYSNTTIRHTEEDGWTRISYPEANWDQYRAFHGWAALQYQVILRTNISVPQDGSYKIELVQAVEFALLNRAHPHDPVTWYNGDIYSYAEYLSDNLLHTPSQLARTIHLAAGEYVALVKAIFEVRIYGEPGAGVAPEIKFRLVAARDDNNGLVHQDALDVVADVVDGWYLGSVLGIGLRNAHASEPVQIDDVLVEEDMPELELSILTQKHIIQPGQTRVLAITFQQGKALAHRRADIKLKIKAGDQEVSVRVPLTHKEHWYIDPAPAVFTHGSPSDSPTIGVLVPPTAGKDFELDLAAPSILATHGAGVAVRSAEWTDSMPRRRTGWAILASGMTEWGLDWHGATMSSAWGAANAAFDIIEGMSQQMPRGKKLTISRQLLLMGHSNGGQGAWHLAARYPDAIVGVVPAAGYLKIQSYDPYLAWRSAHFADPALMGILQAALTPYDNDLYASNLAFTPVLAVHGEADDNVAVQQSRLHVDLVNAWRGNTTAEFEEVPGRPHFWSSVFNSSAVQDFVAGPQPSQYIDRNAGFSVTTANPDESGGLRGIRIVELETPGRLGRIDVLPRPAAAEGSQLLRLRLKNVAMIMISRNALRDITHLEIKSSFGLSVISLNGCESTCVVDLSRCRIEKGDGVSLPWTDCSMSLSTVSSVRSKYRPSGPMLRILSSDDGPLIFVTGSAGGNYHSKNVAARLAHDMLVYHRIDTVIMTDLEALPLLASGALNRNNLVSIGRMDENVVTQYILSESASPIHSHANGVFELHDRVFYEAGTGLIALQPHPGNPLVLACILAGTDEAGIESATRLFPIRTGVPVPEWVITTPKTAWQGAGGFAGAGFWDGRWKWSPSMSWLE